MDKRERTLGAARWAQLAGLLFLAFMLGALLTHLRLPPGPQIALAIRTVKALAAEADAYLGVEPVEHLRPLRFEQTGFAAPFPDAVSPGVTFLVSIFEGRFTARLYASDGALIHEWPVDFFDLEAEGKGYRFNALIHGAHLYPNGDFIANLDARGVVRVSACGDIVWRNDSRAHHSIDVASDGTIWAPRHAAVKTEPRLAAIPVRFDHIGAFDPETGAMMRDIDLAESVIAADLEGLVRTNDLIHNDVMHLNDVEVLDPDMADAFPMFDTGDKILNSRHFNQIWVIDGETGRPKWWKTGPFIGAHDPDFQPDGTITLLDNRPTDGEPQDATGLGAYGGSRILRIDPATRGVEVIYQSGAHSSFYTPYRGKHQVLENGNILIAETDAGRAMEVDPQGRVVWQFVNAWDETRVAWMMDAIRYPDHYADFAAEPCP